mgnify:CR=1 FL=1
MIWDFPKPLFKTVRVNEYTNKSVMVRDGFIRVIFVRANKKTESPGQKTLIVGRLVIHLIRTWSLNFCHNSNSTYIWAAQIGPFSIWWRPKQTYTA